MSKSINEVNLLGNLGKNPEITYTQSGKAVAKFSLATTSSIKNSSGEWEDRTEWHSIQAWEKLAELIGQYLVKGSKVFIKGRLSTTSWEDKQSGEKKYRTDVIASDVVFLDNKQQESKPTPAVDDSDIPF